MTTLSTLAQYRMDYGDHMDNGWGWGMVAMMLLVVAVVVVLVVWLIRTSGASHAHSHTHAHGTPLAETPMQILDRRLASGEITPEEYKERAAILGGS
jgi:putative membrane protein